MSNEVDLLRMLEPAVRPGGLPAGTQKPRVPIEARSFDTLLEEARHMNESDSASQETGVSQAAGNPAKPGQAGLMGRLAQFGGIENGSLRHLLEDPTASRSSKETNGNKQTNTTTGS